MSSPISTRKKHYDFEYVEEIVEEVDDSYQSKGKWKEGKDGYLYLQVEEVYEEIIEYSPRGTHEQSRRLVKLEKAPKAVSQTEKRKVEKKRNSGNFSDSPSPSPSNSPLSRSPPSSPFLSVTRTSRSPSSDQQTAVSPLRPRSGSEKTQLLVQQRTLINQEIQQQHDNQIQFQHDLNQRLLQQQREFQENHEQQQQQQQQQNPTKDSKKKGESVKQLSQPLPFQRKTLLSPSWDESAHITPSKIQSVDSVVRTRPRSCSGSSLAALSINPITQNSSLRETPPPTLLLVPTIPLPSLLNTASSSRPPSLDQKIFGVALRQLMESQQARNDPASSSLPIPSIISKLIEHIKRKGFEEKGLFRLCGHHQRQKELESQINLGKDVDLDSIEIHTVADTLKSFLRQLPEPLICRTPFFYYFVKASAFADDELRFAFFSGLIHALPKENLEMLKAFLLFLHELGLNEQVTKMPVSNLSIIFAPSIFGTLEADFSERAMTLDPMSLLKESKLTSDITLQIIQNAKRIFSNDLSIPVQPFYANECITQIGDSKSTILRGDTVLVIRSNFEKKTSEVLIGEFRTSIPTSLLAGMTPIEFRSLKGRDVSSLFTNRVTNLVVPPIISRTTETPSAAYLSSSSLPTATSISGSAPSPPSPLEKPKHKRKISLGKLPGVSLILSSPSLERKNQRSAKRRSFVLPSGVLKFDSVDGDSPTGSPAEAP